MQPLTAPFLQTVPAPVLSAPEQWLILPVLFPAALLWLSVRSLSPFSDQEVSASAVRNQPLTVPVKLPHPLQTGIPLLFPQSCGLSLHPASTDRSSFLSQKHR